MKRKNLLQTTIAAVFAIILAGTIGCSKTKTCGCGLISNIRIIDSVLFETSHGEDHIPCGGNDYINKTIEKGECSDLNHKENKDDSEMNEYGFVEESSVSCSEI